MTSVAEAVQALRGLRLVEVRRVANIVIIGFGPGDRADRTIHAQCPFRVVHGDVILLGSRDMNWSRDRGTDRDEAFENVTTKYDAQAEFLTARFAEGDFRVTDAKLGPGGQVVVEATDDGDPIALEIFPDCSGPWIESWRLFALEEGSEHFVYPEHRPRVSWFAVRCVFRWAGAEGQPYEERLTLWRATDLDAAIARAEEEARVYAENTGVTYLGLAQGYETGEQGPTDGSEVFSLLRESALPPEEYLDRHFDTGGEHQGA
ncbi:hypothetical protein [Amycolatopsis tolypomycina]|uniref:hypothetical protein n=1 Tax=Amycolatopsis tolypomycina TaxID=208445 RepID=UPI0033A718CE